MSLHINYGFFSVDDKRGWVALSKYFFFNYGKTQINSERKGLTYFNQKAAELLNLKKSLFLSCDGLLENFSLRRIWHRKFWTIEERGWRKGAVWNVVHLVGGHSTKSTAVQLCSVFGWEGEGSSVCRCVHKSIHSHTHTKVLWPVLKAISQLWIPLCYFLWSASSLRQF